MITVTESAKKQAIRLMEDDNMTGAFIRVGVEGGGLQGVRGVLRIVLRSLSECRVVRGWQNVPT